MCVQATELAELTSKISQLEDAKKKKDEEAKRWQKRVRINQRPTREVKGESNMSQKGCLTLLSVKPWYNRGEASITHKYITRHRVVMYEFTECQSIVIFHKLYPLWSREQTIKCANCMQNTYTNVYKAFHTNKQCYTWLVCSLNIITSGKEVVCRLVYLFVYLTAGSHIKYWTDLHHTWLGDETQAREEPNKLRCGNRLPFFYIVVISHKMQCKKKRTMNWTEFLQLGGIIMELLLCFIIDVISSELDTRIGMSGVGSRMLCTECHSCLVIPQTRPYFYFLLSMGVCCTQCQWQVTWFTEENNFVNYIGGEILFLERSTAKTVVGKKVSQMFNLDFMLTQMYFRQHFVRMGLQCFRLCKIYFEWTLRHYIHLYPTAVL